MINNNLLSLLPREIKYYILSYLYYSDYLCDYIKNINLEILNFNNNLLQKLVSEFNIKVINYCILKYYIYDKVNILKYNLNYDWYETSYEYQKSEIIRTFNEIELIDARRIYNYILNRY